MSAIPPSASMGVFGDHLSNFLTDEVEFKNRVRRQLSLPQKNLFETHRKLRVVLISYFVETRVTTP
jgi:hypothetical protein